MLSNILSLSLLSLLPINAYAGHGNPLLNRHHDLAKRADGHIDVFKRAAGAKMSYYNVQTGNAGSCGKFHVNSDFTVALNAAQMNSGLCFKTIRISYGGKTTTATISDTCPGCPYNGLDLTEGLFAFFAPHSVGIIYGDWEFADAAPAPVVTPKKTTTTPVWVAPTTTKTTTPVWVAPTTAWTPKPTPTTTWTPPTTSTKASSTHVSSSSSVFSSSSSSQISSSAKSISSAGSSSSIDYSTGAAAGLAVPTGTVNRTPNSPQNLADLYQVFVQVGGVAAAANNI